MGIRQFKPVTPSSRFRSVSDFAEITRTTPEKSLLEPLTKSGGRDNHGHIAMRRRGGGHKRMYRVIDFKRGKFGIAATVREIEYDPNRSARIALVEYADGEKRYILHPKGLSVGDTVVSGPGSDIRIGNAMPLFEIPLGTAVHNIRAQGRQGRAALPLRGDERAGRREGRRVRDGSHAVNGDADGAHEVSRHDRCGGERRARVAVVGKGREDAVEGTSLQGPWRGHEPRRSPAGRR